MGPGGPTCSPGGHVRGGSGPRELRQLSEPQALSLLELQLHLLREARGGRVGDRLHSRNRKCRKQQLVASED